MNTDNGHAGVRTKKILFVTNAESGQANTILAMALEASTRPHVEAHVASFPVLEKRVRKLSPKIQFHPLGGMDFMEMVGSNGFPEEKFPHRPRSGVLSTCGKFVGVVLAGWDEECALSSPCFFFFLRYGCYLMIPYFPDTSSIYADTRWHQEGYRRAGPGCNSCGFAFGSWV